MKKKTFSLCPDVSISPSPPCNPQPSPPSSPQTFPHLTGLISPFTMSDFTFNDQYYTYNTLGFLPPNFNSDPTALFPYPRAQSKKLQTQLKKTREKYNNPSTSSFNGPWAKYTSQLTNIPDNTDNSDITLLTQDQKSILSQFEQSSQQKPQLPLKPDSPFSPSSIFHLESETDYQGRSFLSPPKNLKNVEHNCYIPKKLIFTYSGHTKPVQEIAFFPKYGHYLLSCSLDHKIKLWDVLSTRKCARTYIGHSQGVRAICFSNDGTKFLSAGFDKLVRLWDTESGKVLRTFPLQKIPFCVLFNPDNDKQNEFLVGTSVKKIYQYDINSTTQVHCYDEHLGAINTLTFIDNNRKFVSTSDDKKIFIWEYGLPVVVKHISEPSMHSIPAVAMHPNGKYFLGQSLDNKIVVYDCKNGFKINRKKKFVGHVNAGYACGLDFSPDGQFLCSGDADGKLWFWDWRTTKNYTTLNAHNKICIDVKWHPVMPSMVASCSWDGTVKLWEAR